jgi:hypothetical protein
MTLRSALFLAVALLANSVTGAESRDTGPAPAEFQDFTFLRVVLPGGRSADALRLIRADGNDPGRVVLVEGDHLALLPEVDVNAFSSPDASSTLQPDSLSGTMTLSFGGANFSRQLKEGARAASLTVSAKERELTLKYVVVPGTEARAAYMAVAWRLYENNRLMKSGCEAVPMREGQKVGIPLKPARGKAVADMTVRFEKLPEAGRH